MYYKPLNAEIAAPTTQATASTVSAGKAIRAVNTSTNTAHLVSLVDNNPQTTSVVNATAQTVITMDSVVGVEVGDVATATNITAGTVVASISGNAVTLGAALTGAIDGSGTAISVKFDRVAGSMSVNYGETAVIDKNQTQSLFAANNAVKLSSITYPKG